MGFRINTNIGAMQAHMYNTFNNKRLDNSLTRLSSGLRASTKQRMIPQVWRSPTNSKLRQMVWDKRFGMRTMPSD